MSERYSLRSTPMRERARASAAPQGATNTPTGKKPSAPARANGSNGNGLKARSVGRVGNEKRGMHEIWRKVFHVLPGLVTYGLYLAGFYTGDVAYVICFLMVWCASLEYIRLCVVQQDSHFFVIFMKLFGFMMRPDESQKVHSTMYYLVGVWLVLSLAAPRVAVCSILFLAFCDPAATLAGRNLGHLGPRLTTHKSLLGSVGAGLVGSLIATHILGLDNLQEQLLCGAIAAFSEALPVPTLWNEPLDDNLVIPVTSAGLLTLFSYS